MKRTLRNILIMASILVVVTLVVAGNFIHSHKRSEAFGKTYNLMNADYKSVLFASGQNSSETRQLMANYKISFEKFYDSYASNPILPYDEDAEWKNSLDVIKSDMLNADVLIENGELLAAHSELEKIRQEWQEIFKRNNVTMLGFYLTEFHDIMEEAIEESEKEDFEKLDTICVDMTNVWVEVLNTQTEFGNIQDYNDMLSSETRAIKEFCDAVNTRQDSVKGLSAKLKPGFVSFYIKYG